MNLCRIKLRRVEENDETLTKLYIGDYYDGDISGSDYSQLGAAIGENTHLKTLTVVLDGITLDVTDREFYDGLKQNMSIYDLYLDCRSARNIVSGVGHEILKIYQENINLTRLQVDCADLQNGGNSVITTTLRNCTNLNEISLPWCTITDEQLIPIVEAVQGHSSLKRLGLNNNRVSNAGCDALATLLRDPNCNLHTLHLGANAIDNVGANTLVKSLVNNTKLKALYINANPIDASVHDIFSKLLCNTSNINNIYSSNHSLGSLLLPQCKGEELASLLNMNDGTDESHIAMRKILKYHPSIDMEPFFEWNMEGEGERNLKALPYVIAWFERAREADADDEGWEESYNIGERKLSAIYQFAKAMPLLFVPVPHCKGGDNKRKRVHK